MERMQKWGMMIILLFDLQVSTAIFLYCMKWAVLPETKGAHFSLSL